MVVPNLPIATMMDTVQNMAEEVVEVVREVLIQAEMGEALFMGLVEAQQAEVVQDRLEALEVHGSDTLLVEAVLLGHRIMVKMVQTAHRDVMGVEMVEVVDKE